MKVLSATFLALLATLAAADTRFQWMNGPSTNAQTSLVSRAYNAGDLNILYTAGTPPFDSGALFYYSKFTLDNTQAPLVTVYLYNAELGLQIPLQAGFDTIYQTQSAYWIDAKVLATSNPSIQTSTKYQLWFKSEATGSTLVPVDEKSGFFGITVGASPATATGITSPPVVPSAPKTTNKLSESLKQASTDQQDPSSSSAALFGASMMMLVPAGISLLM